MPAVRDHFVMQILEIALLRALGEPRLVEHDDIRKLDMLEQRVLLFLMPVPFVLAGRAWGLSHPVYGEAFGAALGLGIGHLASNALCVGVGLAVLRKLGMPLSPLFLAQFDRGTAKRQLFFGLKIAAGTEPIAIQASMQYINQWATGFSEVVNAEFRAEMRKRGKEI